MGLATADPTTVESVALLREIFAAAVRLLRAAGLEAEARKVDGCELDPTTPHACTYGVMTRVELTTRMEWGAQLMGRGTSHARAVEGVHVAFTAFLSAATSVTMPVDFLRQLRTRVVAL